MKRYPLDTYEYISCRICSKRMKQIHHVHLRIHGTTIEEYKKKFPGAPTRCEKGRDHASNNMKNWAKENPEKLKEHSEKIKKVWRDPKKRSQFLKSFAKRPPQSQEVRNRISQTMKKHYETHPEFPRRVQNENQTGENNPFYGKHHTQEVKDYLSKSNKEYAATHPEYLEWRSKITKQWHKENKELFKKIRSKSTCFRTVGSNKGPSRGEALVIELFDSLNISYQYDLNVIDVDDSGITRVYKIDFAFSDQTIALELDSEMHLLPERQIRDLRKNKILKREGWNVHRIVFNSKNLEELMTKVRIFIQEVLNEN